jgi:hypothetical protein
VDRVPRAYYELKFELAFLKLDGNAFQDFFSEIMEKRYPGDFQRVRPWGKRGDRKNDGYLKSDRRLFQLYAPKTFKIDRLLKKISTDFKGALPYWKDYFDKWTFVHNDRDGLAPDVLKILMELEIANKPVTCSRWGFQELHDLFFELDELGIISIFGYAPSDRDIQNIRFDNLKPVLDHIASKRAADPPDLRPVPSNKLAANALSENVEILLSAGMKKADLVGEFFSKGHVPTYGDSIAEAFRDKYRELRTAGYLPDDIFSRLWEFAGGTEKGSPGHQAAVLAVLAHLFEQCDIFERPVDGDQEPRQLSAGGDPAPGLLESLSQPRPVPSEVPR